MGTRGLTGYPYCLLPAAFCLLLLACRPASFDAARVGVVAPLTGERAAVGRDIADGVRLAVEEWNRAGGVHGLYLELVTYDQEQAATRRLTVDPRVVLAVGYPDLAAASAAQQAYGDAGAPAAVLLARPPETAASRPSGLLALAPTPEQVASVAVAAVAYNFGPANVAVVASENPEDLADARAFIQAAPGRDLRVVAALTVAPLETSFVRLAATIRAAAPHVVYVAGRGVDAGALWTEVRLRDARIRLVLGPGALDRGFFGTASGFVEGVVAIELSQWPPVTPTAVAFDATFTARFGRPPSVAAAHAYDAAALGLRAIARATTGELPTRSAVRATLTAETSLNGVLRRYALSGGAPDTWTLAVYRLDRDGVPSLIGEAEIR